MVIKLEDFNPGNIQPLFIGTRARLSTATAVRFVDARRLLATSLVGRRLYLIEFDVASGQHKVLSAVDTQFAGRSMMTDLMDYDGREFVVTSDCGKCAVSLYRLADNELSFVKDFPIAPPDSAFCHGARFVPPGDVICATFSTGFQIFFISKATGEIIYQFTDGDWRPKDVNFISPTKMVVLFARATAAFAARDTYASKVSLITFDLAQKTHTIISELVTEDSHVDCCRYADGRVYVNNQMRDSLLILRVENDRLVFEQEHFGYDFPHGVDVLPAANLLAVTNYGSNSIFLGSIPPSEPPVLHKKSSVLAIVTHHERESWLEQALTSLTAQTHPPDNIVVIDDGSAKPPLAILKKFPQTTLLAAPENVGPYRLLQTIVNLTNYDGYLIHDADDWATPDLLALLLAEAEKSGAEIIGPQFDHVHEDGRHEPVARPLNASAAYAADPTSHFICFGASLISRKLLRRLGGFASGLRFSGDAEFFRRASHVAKLANIPQTCYFHRKHPGSLTQRLDTGMNSPARKELDDALKARANENAAAVAAGRPPNLDPFATGTPVELKHLCGPTLRPAPAPRVTLIAGMHRSGTSMLAQLLAACGLDFGATSDLVPATPDNPEGHYEHIRLQRVNDELLNAFGGGWDLPPAWPKKFLADARVKTLAYEVKNICRENFSRGDWAWKDPRSSLALPFWLAALPHTKVLVCLRNPLEVAHSLRRRGHASYAFGLNLWQIYNERILADTAPAQRLITHYENFFAAPETELRRILKFLGHEISAAQLAFVCAGIKSQHRHNRFTDDDLRAAGASADLLALYERLRAEANGEVGKKFSPARKKVSAAKTAAPAINSALADLEIARREIAALREQNQRFKNVATTPIAPPPVADGRDQTIRALRAQLWQTANESTDPDLKDYLAQISRVRDFITARTSPSATLLVASKGEELWLDLPVARVWHFPSDIHGQFAGHHFADSAEAIAALDAARARGASHLLIPAAQLWWLEHYAEFATHLAQIGKRNFYEPEVGAIFYVK
ncbi:MAG: hypothetical protein RLZZ350_551 [Verrucomicrobiota bacterium]